jgi:lysophospholipase L1-like esterase
LRALAAAARESARLSTGTGPDSADVAVMRRLLWISLAANMIGLVAAIALATHGRQIARAILLQPIRERLVSFFEASPVRPGDVVFLGDSLTDGARWEELFPGLAVRNRGVPGDTTADVLARLDQVTSGKPAQVLLMIGTNDLGFGASVEATATRYEAILAALRRDAPATRIAVLSVLPRSASDSVRIEALNRAIRELARSQGAQWIDLDPAFLAPDGSIRDDLSNDELHLTGAGYLEWRRRISPYVECRAEQPCTDCCAGTDAAAPRSRED